MVDTLLLANIFTDVTAILILLYIAIVLAFSENNYVKENILLHYEAMKRDKAFRKALAILGLSVILSLTATFIGMTSEPNMKLIHGVQISSRIFRILFFIYLIAMVKVTKH